MATTKAELSAIAKREMDKVFALRRRNEQLARDLQARPLRLRDVFLSKRLNTQSQPRR
jgi:hypothetical protein